jgi:hypothetical protein
MMSYICNDKEALRAYQMREMALSDWTSGVNHARREGREEGLRDAARNLKAMGLTAAQIEKLPALRRNRSRNCDFTKVTGTICVYLRIFNRQVE